MFGMELPGGWSGHEAAIMFVVLYQNLEAIAARLIWLGDLHADQDWGSEGLSHLLLSRSLSSNAKSALSMGFWTPVAAIPR